jgi:hypothetical protein
MHILWRLIVLAAVLIASPSFAAAPSTHYVHITVSTLLGAAVQPMKWYKEKGAACSGMAGAISGKYYSNPWIYSGGAYADGNTNCIYSVLNQTTAQGSTVNGGSNYVSQMRCDDGITKPDLTKPLAQQCPDPQPSCPASGPGSDMTVTTGWRTGPDPSAPYAKQYPSPIGGAYCQNKCTVNISSVEDCSLSGDAEGGYYRQTCTYGTEHNGANCTSSPDPDEGKTPPTEPPPEKNRCPLGTKQTGIDSSGIAICTGDAPPSPPPPKTTQTTTTQNPDGSTTQTTTETTTNGDGSTTTKTTTTTTGTDGTQTKSEATTTSSTPLGKPGTSDGQPEDRSDLCKRNPTLNICRNSSVSGACENVSCDGDAIQCAMYRQMQKEYCENRQVDAAKTLGDQIMTGADPQASTLPTKANGSTLAMGSIDQSGFLGGGACFSDKTISFRGQSITIPFSSACQYLIVFRYVIMIIAALVCFRMLSGVIFRS